MRPHRVFVVFACVFLAAAALEALARMAPLTSELVSVLTPALFIVVAVREARRAGGLEHHGIRLGGLLDLDATLPPWSELIRTALPEVGMALLTAAVLFPPFVVAFAWWHRASGPFSLGFDRELLGFVASQFAVIAVSEEVFFRGWVQTQLEARWPPSVRILGAPISPTALILQSTLFASIHLTAGLDPARLATFFPGLVFGWLRAKRGGVGAAIAFHALCNVLAEVLIRGWFAP